MNPALRNPLWWTACLVSVATGTWLGSPRTTTTNLVVGDARERPASPSASAAAASRNDIRRALDRFDNASLFESLLEPEGLSHEVVKSVIDREGWKAWPKVLAITDPELREKLSDTFLRFYAERDPLQAFAEWKKHRGEFPAESWGNYAIMEITGAAAQSSAESLIEVFEGSRSDVAYTGMSANFADDFDFAQVMDYLASAQSRRQVDVLNLLTGWAERSPLQAAKWIEGHRDFVMSSGNLNLTSTMRQVVAADLHLSERVQALDALRTLPEATIDQMWNEAIKSSAGVPQASLLESATMMNRREVYLTAVLLEARRQDSLDDSWKLISPGERAAIAEDADASWDPGSSPVEMKSKERWRAMIANAWGLDP